METNTCYTVFGRIVYNSLNSYTKLYT